MPDYIYHAKRQAVRLDEIAGFQPEIIAANRGLSVEQVKAILDRDYHNSQLGYDLRGIAIREMKAATRGFWGPNGFVSPEVAVRAVKGYWCDVCPEWGRDF